MDLGFVRSSLGATSWSERFTKSDAQTCARPPSHIVPSPTRGGEGGPKDRMRGRPTGLGTPSTTRAPIHPPSSVSFADTFSRPCGRRTERTSSRAVAAASGPITEMLAVNPEDRRRVLQVGARGSAPHCFKCIKDQAMMRAGGPRSNFREARTYPWIDAALCRLERGPPARIFRSASRIKR